jgi:hypothetical protein
MAYYRVLLHGTGICIHQEGSDPIIGFYTTRAVKADSISEAIEGAKALVDAEWTRGPHCGSNEGERPTLAVEQVYSENFLGYLKFRNKGYTFYADGESRDHHEY